MACTGWALLERVHTLRGTVAGEDQVAADTELTIPPYV